MKKQIVTDHPVRVARNRHGLSQFRLGIQVGAHPNVISGIENGRIWPWPRLRRELSKTLGVPEEELFPRDLLRMS